MQERHAGMTKYTTYINALSDSTGCNYSTLDGELHSFNDLPACITRDSDAGFMFVWMCRGKITRVHKPAVVMRDLSTARRHGCVKLWFTDGELVPRSKDADYCATGWRCASLAYHCSALGGYVSGKRLSVITAGPTSVCKVTVFDSEKPFVAVTCLPSMQAISDLGSLKKVGLAVLSGTRGTLIPYHQGQQTRLRGMATALEAVKDPRTCVNVDLYNSMEQVFFKAVII